MNFRISPEDLIPRPGARERILRAGDAYQAQRVGKPYRNIPIRCEVDDAALAAAHATEQVTEATDRLTAVIAMAIAAFIRSAPQPAPAEASKVILEQVAAKHGVEVDDLRGPRRTPRLVDARHEACYRLHNERKNLSLPMIGRLLNRDHTTILYAVRKFKKMNTVTNPEQQVGA